MPDRGVEQDKSEYRGFLDLSTLGELPTIWTPSGSYTAPGFLQTEVKCIGYSLQGSMAYLAKETHPSARIPTSGEWYRLMEFLGEKDPALSDRMVTEGVQRTSTLIDYDHGKLCGNGKWFDGLLYQIPELDGDSGCLADDQFNGIVRARYVDRMALPLNDFNVRNMLPEFEPLLNAIFGMEDARRQLLSKNVRFWIDENPSSGGRFSGLRNIFRGDRYKDAKFGRYTVRASVLRGIRYYDKQVGSRAVIEA